MNKGKENINNNNNIQKENIPSIKFKRKKRKSTTILFTKIIFLIIITAGISTFFSTLVFNIKYKDLVDKMNKKMEDDNASLEYSNVINKVKDSLVTIGVSKESLTQNKYVDGNTTGIIIESSGKIVTNYSTIKDMKEIYVKLSFVGSEPLKAEIIFSNEGIDIAIIKVDCDEDLTPIKFASSDKIIDSQRILLISNSTSDEYIDNLVPGIVTSKNRKIDVENKNYNLFEVNTPINKFNTGGIISSLKGELIGVASKKLTDDMNISGLYYAIDLSSVGKVANYANKIKDMLGIIEGEFIKGNSVDSCMEFYVARVNQNGNSYKAGLRPTDIILEIDGQKINKITQVFEMLKNKKNGDTVTCKVMRSGDVRDIEIILDNIEK